MEIAACPIWCCCDDGDLARRVAAVQVAFYIPFLPQEFLDIHIANTNVSTSLIRSISAAWRAGDLVRAAGLVTPELAAMFSIAGTPAECLDTMNGNGITGRFDHIVLMIVDGGHVAPIWRDDRTAPTGIPSVRDQMEIFNELILPGLQFA
jgi:hypothetical protein